MASNTETDNWLPSVAMQFNGYFLEDKLTGYQTLTVSGREVLSYELNNSGTISGRDGVIPISKNLPSRVITVQYMLKADDNEEFQLKFRRLNMLLDSEEEIPIRFRDEADVEYIGQLETMEDVPADRNTVIGTFTIHCSDPYKYQQSQRLIGNPINVYLSSTYKVHPTEIRLTTQGATDKITVDNIDTGRHIILNGTYNANDEIVIKIEDKDITQNGQNIMNQLDFMESDFHDFWLNSGDTIDVTPSNTTMAMTIRGRYK